MDETHIAPLNRPDVAAPALTGDEILDAAKASIAAQGGSEAGVEPCATMSAVGLSSIDVMDRMVVAGWGQCRGGRSGSLRAPSLSFIAPGHALLRKAEARGIGRRPRCA